MFFYEHCVTYALQLTISVFRVSDSELRLLSFDTWLLDSFVILHSSALNISINVFRFVKYILRMSLSEGEFPQAAFSDCALANSVFLQIQLCDSCLAATAPRISVCGYWLTDTALQMRVCEFPPC